MNYRRLFSVTVSLLLAITGVGCSEQINNIAPMKEVAEKEQRPNIIFIFADDWGWGDLGVHGSDRALTPNIDKLASQGTDFYQFSVTSPVCSPSRTSVMTGHFPERYNIGKHFASIEHHQRANMPDWLDPQAPSLPRMLNDAGYATGHFGKWHLTNIHIKDAPLPPEYGYDEFAAFNLPGKNIRTSETADYAVDFIRRHSDKPFFMNLWIHETHTPHYPEAQLMKKFEHLSEQEQVYSAILAAGDRDVGRIVNVLEELNLTSNTLVIFSSDNGPEISLPGRRFSPDQATGRGLGMYYSVGETMGLKGRKRSLYAGGVRVPFIVKWPGVTPAGGKDKVSVLSAVDLLPTFVSLAGASLPEGYVPDGEDMTDALKGKAFSRKKSLYWVWPNGKAAKSTKSANWPQFGIQKGPWKLLVNESLDTFELYNVKSDWYEKNNVIDSHPEVSTSLLAELGQIRSKLPSSPPAHTFSKYRESSTANQ